jgi:hypothetical protein
MAPASCYGSTQTYADALMLKLLPATWLKKDPLRFPEKTTPWIYMSHYPNANLALRVSRVFYAMALCLTLIALARFFFSFSWIFSIYFSASP